MLMRRRGYRKAVTYAAKAIQNNRSFFCAPDASLNSASNIDTNGRTPGYSIFEGYNRTSKLELIEFINEWVSASLR